MKHQKATTNLRLSNKNFEDSILHYLLLMLACMNFTGRSGLILLLWGVYALFRYFLANRLKFDIGSAITLFLAFAVLLPSCIWIDKFDLISSVTSLNFFLPYFIGFGGYLVAADKQKYVKNTMLSLFAGFAIYVAAVYIYNLYKGTFSGNTLNYLYSLTAHGDRMILDIWTQDQIAATYVGLLGAVVIGYSFYAIFCSKTLLLKLLGGIALIFVLLVNFSTATRTPVILFVLVYGFMIMLLFINSKQKKALFVVAGIFAMTMLIMIMYAYDIMGLKSFLERAPLLDRFQKEGFQTSRFDIAKTYLSYMWEFPWGGGHVTNKIHLMAHNYLQEGHDLYGIFATIALVTVTVSIGINVLRLTLVKNKQPLDFLFLTMYISIWMQCCVEPVFEGYATLFWILLLVHGLATAYWKDRQNQLESEEHEDR